jgi:hypothetical protein
MHRIIGIFVAKTKVAMRIILGHFGSADVPLSIRSVPEILEKSRFSKFPWPGPGGKANYRKYHSRADTKGGDQRVVTDRTYPMKLCLKAS